MARYNGIVATRRLDVTDSHHRFTFQDEQSVFSLRNTVSKRFPTKIRDKKGSIWFLRKISRTCSMICCK